MSEAPVKLLERLMHGERLEPDDQVCRTRCQCMSHLRRCCCIPVMCILPLLLELLKQIECIRIVLLQGISCASLKKHALQPPAKYAK